MDAPSKPKKLLPHNVQHTRPTGGQQKPETAQIQRSFQETVISWLPTDSNTFLFELVVVIYLIIAVIHFGLTGDTSMLVTLLPYMAAYKGLTEVKPLLSKTKNEESEKQ
jgi:hypothetical protein